MDRHTTSDVLDSVALGFSISRDTPSTYSYLLSLATAAKGISRNALEDGTAHEPED